MVDGDIGNSSVPAQEVSALPVNVHDWEHLVILKGVETPSFLWNPSFWGLAVFNHDAAESV